MLVVFYKSVVFGMVVKWLFLMFKLIWKFMLGWNWLEELLSNVLVWSVLFVLLIWELIWVILVFISFFLLFYGLSVMFGVFSKMGNVVLGVLKLIKSLFLLFSVVIIVCLLMWLFILMLVMFIILLKGVMMCLFCKLVWVFFNVIFVRLCWVCVKFNLLIGIVFCL